jgi:hypothetical protein
MASGGINETLAKMLQNRAGGNAGESREVEVRFGRIVDGLYVTGVDEETWDRVLERLGSYDQWSASSVEFSTHVHYDHVMWHPDLGDVPRWATPGTVAMVEADRESVVAPLHGDLPADLVDVAARDLRPIDGELLGVAGAVGVSVSEPLHDGVGVGVALLLCDAVSQPVDESVGVAVFDGVGALLVVGLTVALSVAVADKVAVALAVAHAVMLAVAVVDGEDVGDAAAHPA